MIYDYYRKLLFQILFLASLVGPHPFHLSNFKCLGIFMFIQTESMVMLHANVGMARPCWTWNRIGPMYQVGP